MPRPWTRSRNGIALGQLVQPLESVGCYVPGGRYPLVSTVLMTVIPGAGGGCPEHCEWFHPIRLQKYWRQPHAGCYASSIALAAHRPIAALAYGTDSITRVDKIVGPGNSYVTAAKKLVSFDCAIDFLAGPTEALIMSDSGNAGIHRRRSRRAGRA